MLVACLVPTMKFSIMYMFSISQKAYLVLSFLNTVSMIAYQAYWQSGDGWGPQRTQKSAAFVYYVLKQHKEQEI